ncbi:MAG: diguanylate cyclase [Deltaproteobacteria bacterium]|nr:diguanylate cyclase [Deltaproteobacteria bacterium]
MRDEQTPVESAVPAILLVESDAEVTEAFTRAFDGEFAVHAVASGEEAVDALQSQDFAVLVADYDLPGMSGIEVLEQSIQAAPDLRRFLVTSSSDPKLVMAAMNRARIDQYVIKPWDEAALRIALRRAAETRATLLEARAQMSRLRAQNMALGQKVKERTREIGEIAERQRRLSVIDGTTGLHNHRHFRERWQGEVRRCRRYGQTVALIHLEIDHAAKVQDAGPGATDGILKDLAILLRSSVRGVDLVARFGIREYAIVLPATPKPNGALLAGRLSQCVRDHTLKMPGGALVTVSVGVGAFPDDGDTSSDVLARTRSAMKRSRAVGGNRVYIVSDEDEGLLPGQEDAAPASEEALRAFSSSGGDYGLAGD